MRIRALLVLAIAAVLCGAPSPAFGASKNLLSAAAVTPPSGTTVTLFTLSVAYTGDSPALSVSATVGSSVLPMLLVSGTPSDGTWRATTLLPSGTWPTTFRAAATYGENASTDGPTISVGKPLLPSPPPGTASPTDLGTPPPSDDPEAIERETSTSTPTPAPAVPATSAQPSPTLDGETLSPDAPEQVNRPPSAAPAPGAAGPATSSTPGAAVPTDGRRTAAPNEGTSGSTSSSPPSADAAAVTTTGPVAPELAPMLAVGVGGAAALVLSALFLGLVARRRRTAKDALGIGGEVTAARRAVDDEVAATLHRRTLRRSKMRLEEDPIIAAIGVDTPSHPGRDRSRRRSPPT